MQNLHPFQQFTKTTQEQINFELGEIARMRYHLECHQALELSGLPNWKLDSNTGKTVVAS